MVKRTELRNSLIMLTFTCSSPTSVAHSAVLYASKELCITSWCHPSVALFSHASYIQVSSEASKLEAVQGPSLE